LKYYDKEMKMKLGFKRVHKDAKIPTYGSEGAACMDLYAVEDYYLKPGDVRLLNTGLAFEVPFGYELQIRPRGSAIKNQIIILNSPGTVDSDFRGSVFVGVKNIGTTDFSIKKGDRVAQMTLKEVINLEMYEVEELSETLRGDGCLGSTGR
jgi:dUTP pyrophosphatase